MTPAELSGLMTGHRVIDLQHQELFDMIGEVGQMLGADFDLKSVNPVLQGLQRYVLVHFAHEETLMRQSVVVSPDHIESHLMQHVAFAEEVERSRYQLQRGELKREQVRKLSGFLTIWLVNHIQGTDRELVRQLDAPAPSHQR